MASIIENPPKEYQDFLDGKNDKVDVIKSDISHSNETTNLK